MARRPAGLRRPLDLTAPACARLGVAPAERGPQRLGPPIDLTGGLGGPISFKSLPSRIGLVLLGGRVISLQRDYGRAGWVSDYARPFHANARRVPDRALRGAFAARLDLLGRR